MYCAIVDMLVHYGPGVYELRKSSSGQTQDGGRPPNRTHLIAITPPRIVRLNLVRGCVNGPRRLQNCWTCMFSTYLKIKAHNDCCNVSVLGLQCIEIATFSTLNCFDDDSSDTVRSSSDGKSYNRRLGSETALVAVAMQRPSIRSALVRMYHCHSGLGHHRRALHVCQSILVPVVSMTQIELCLPRLVSVSYIRWDAYFTEIFSRGIFHWRFHWKF